MANFNTHLFVAAVTGSSAAIVAVNWQLIDILDAPRLAALGCLGGLLPDIDSDSSKSLKLLFNWLALTTSITLLFLLSEECISYPVLYLSGIIFLTIRFLLFAVFKYLTVHRGVFHSLLAAVFFCLMAACISFYLLKSSILQSWFDGLFICIGYIAHLALDELSGVDLSNARMKKSFGTAFKLINYNDLKASSFMLLSAFALFSIAPPSQSFIDKLSTGYTLTKTTITKLEIKPAKTINATDRKKTV